MILSSPNTLDKWLRKKSRKGPAGLLYGLIWNTMPAFFYKLDSHLTGGRISSSLRHLSRYLMNENHPLVLVRERKILTDQFFWHLTLDLYTRSSSSPSCWAPSFSSFQPHSLNLVTSTNFLPPLSASCLIFSYSNA